MCEEVEEEGWREMVFVLGGIRGRIAGAGRVGGGWGMGVMGDGGVPRRDGRG